MKKRSLLLLQIFVFSTYVQAQIQTGLPNVILPSPTSQQFQRYGDYPVSHFTGLPDIKYPIYTIKEGDLELPIYLSYHASGTRPNDVSGAVGLGWTLMGGGMISRNIMGKPDETTTFLVPTQKASQINWTAETQMLHDLNEGLNDCQYDIYSYSFNGRSGKYIKKNGQAFQLKASDLKIGYYEDEIIDEHGVRYSFGEPIEYTEYSKPNIGLNFTAPTTWHLSQIGSPSDPYNAINFIYQDGPDLSSYRDVSDMYSIDDFLDYCNPQLGGYGPQSMNNSIYTNGGYQNNMMSVVNRTKILKQITFKSGKVLFIQNPVSKMISSIEVYANGNKLIKKIDLEHELFSTPVSSSNTLSNPFGNIKLKSVSSKNITNNIQEKTEFYYEAGSKPNAYQVGAGTDYWGFYNGLNGYTSQVPSVSTLVRSDCNTSPNYANLPPAQNGTYVDKNPHEQFTKSYILNRIKYPTGGYTDFEYELNRKDNGGLVEYYGGLRIKNIKSYDKNGSLAGAKNYTYNDAVAELLPNSLNYVYTKQTTYDEVIQSRRIIISANPDVDFSPKGSSLTYGSITETEGNQFTTYMYDNDNCYEYGKLDYPAMVATDVPNNDVFFHKSYATNYKPWNFGNFLGKSVGTVVNPFVTVYNTTLGGESIEYEEVVVDTARDFIIERWNTPELLIYSGMGNPNTNPYVPIFPLFPLSSFDNTFPGAFNVNSFNFADRYYLSGGKRVKSKTSSIADNTNNTSLVTTQHFYYDNPLKPFTATRIETSNSKGQDVKTIVKYPYDYPSTAPYNEMVNRNIISPVIEETKTNVTNGVEISKAKVNYAQYPNITNGFVAPSSIQASINSSALKTIQEVEQYDGIGNMLQVKGKDGVVSAYIYGYNNTYPVAQIVGATYATASSYLTNAVILNSPTATDAQIRTELNKIRVGLAGTNAQVTTFTYEPLVGMTSQTDPNGKTLYYAYDGFGRLSTVKNQDGKIVKKLCYKYNGEVEDCGQ